MSTSLTMYVCISAKQAPPWNYNSRLTMLQRNHTLPHSSTKRNTFSLHINLRCHTCKSLDCWLLHRMLPHRHCIPLTSISTSLTMYMCTSAKQAPPWNYNSKLTMLHRNNTLPHSSPKGNTFSLHANLRCHTCKTLGCWLLQRMLPQRHCIPVTNIYIERRGRS